MTEEEALRELRRLVANVLSRRLTDDFIDRCIENKRRGQGPTLEQAVAQWRGWSGPYVLWDDGQKPEP